MLSEMDSHSSQKRIIPDSMIHLLGNLAVDEVVCSLLPDLRASIGPYLPVFAPNVKKMLDRADKMQELIRLAEKCALKVSEISALLYTSAYTFTNTHVLGNSYCLAKVILDSSGFSVLFVLSGQNHIESEDHEV